MADYCAPGGRPPNAEEIKEVVGEARQLSSKLKSLAGKLEELVVEDEDGRT